MHGFQRIQSKRHGEMLIREKGTGHEYSLREAAVVSGKCWSRAVPACGELLVHSNCVVGIVELVVFNSDQFSLGQLCSPIQIHLWKRQLCRAQIQYINDNEHCNKGNNLTS